MRHAGQVHGQAIVLVAMPLAFLRLEAVDAAVAGQRAARPDAAGALAARGDVREVGGLRDGDGTGGAAEESVRRVVCWGCGGGAPGARVVSLLPAGELEFVGAGLEIAGGVAWSDEVCPPMLAGLRGGVDAGDTHDVDEVSTVASCFRSCVSVASSSLV